MGWRLEFPGNRSLQANTRGAHEGPLGSLRRSGFAFIHQAERRAVLGLHLKYTDMPTAKYLIFLLAMLSVSF